MALCVCLLGVAAPAFAQPRIDRATRDALRWPDAHAADVLSTAAVAGAIVTPCLMDRTADCVKTEALRVGAAVVSSLVTKYVMHRTRPDGSDEASFWSMHTSLACAATVGTKAWAFCPSVGYLRVAADKHWFSDVAAGGVVGALLWTVQW